MKKNYKIWWAKDAEPENNIFSIVMKSKMSFQVEGTDNVCCAWEQIWAMENGLA